MDLNFIHISPFINIAVENYYSFYSSATSILFSLEQKSSYLLKYFLIMHQLAFGFNKQLSLAGNGAFRENRRESKIKLSVSVRL